MTSRLFSCVRAFARTRISARDMRYARPQLRTSARVAALACASLSLFAFAQEPSHTTGGAMPNAAHDLASPSKQTHPRELILAGGALKLCSSLAPKDCTPDPVATVGGLRQPVLGPSVRSAPRYSLAPEVVGAAFEQALDPALWQNSTLQPRTPQRKAMRALLNDARGHFGTMTFSEDTFRTHVESRCVSPRGDARSCLGTAKSPWLRLDDEQRSALLAAMELPQFDGATRRRERASLESSRLPYGAEILRAFVAAARERMPGDHAIGDDPSRKPRVAIVTASSFDPFDPLDFYLDALTQAGAEVEWWPVDAALAAAVFNGRGCAALPALRRELLKLPGRERVYPDFAAQQQRACADPQALATLPDRVQGVFFNGGDQWKLRRAFFTGSAAGNNDVPNLWLSNLRAAVARGDVVIGGTSAGSAVQSGGPMLTNGTVENAVKHGAIASPPPVPGCTRSGDCVGGLDEDAFTFWPAGGLGLAPNMIVDTHFSERARELRLLRLLGDTGTRYGIGVDETSALQLRWQGEHDIELRALGKSGGWAFDASPGCRSGADAGSTADASADFTALAHYVAPGAWLRWSERGLIETSVNEGVASGAAVLSTPDGKIPPETMHTEDALDDGTMRAAMLSLAYGVAHDGMRAGDIAVRLTPTDATRTWLAPNAYAGITAVRIALAPWPSCKPPG
jgi:cyanophycinase-like exopeptidase